MRELVARRVVQQRFGFDADTAGDIDELIADTRVAWGFDADDRDRWGAGRDEGRTWRRGLDRALTGVFYADSAARVVRDTVPLDGVEGQDGRPVGLLAALLDRIVAIRDRFAAPMPISHWSAALNESVRMLAAPGWDEEWQWDQLERLLAEAFPLPAAPILPSTSVMPAGCWPVGSTTGPARSTSGPATSPCAPWCRCGRCRTGSSACSAWTTGDSPAGAGTTATICWRRTRSSEITTGAPKTASSSSTQ